MNAELIDIEDITVGGLTHEPWEVHLAKFLVHAGGQVFELSEWAHEGKLESDLDSSNILSWLSNEFEEIAKLTGLNQIEIYAELEAALNRGIK